jgi:hypothetical protein
MVFRALCRNQDLRLLVFLQLWIYSGLGLPYALVAEVVSSQMTIVNNTSSVHIGWPRSRASASIGASRARENIDSVL